MGKLSTFITRLKQTLTKIGEDVKDLRDNKANVSDIPDTSNFVPYTGATQSVNLNGNNIRNVTYYSAYRGSDLTWANAVNSDPEAWNQDGMSLIKLGANNNALAFIANGTANVRKFGIQVGHASPLYASSAGVLWLQPLHGNVGIGSLSGTGDRMVVANSQGILSTQSLPSENYLPLSGGTMTGVVNFTGNNAVPLMLNRSAPNNVLYGHSSSTSTIYSGIGDSNVYAIGDTTDLRQAANNWRMLINSDGRIFSKTDGNSSQWKQAYDWGDFRDYGLGKFMSLGNIGSEGLDSTVNETGFYLAGGIDASIVGSSNVKLINFGNSSISTVQAQVLINHGGTQANRMAFRASQSAQFNEFWHTGNFNPAQYVLQSALNSQLANYVPINGVTTINDTKTFTSAPIVPNGTLNGHTVNLGQLNDKLGEKADIDGSNTTGGSWNISELISTPIGSYSTVYALDNSILNIPSNDVLGISPGILLMKYGFPIVIAENANPDWDGYIYRAGEPKPGYPGNQQNGNYLIESKHRFRLHEVTAPDSTSAGVGYLTVQPFNAIEHSYHRVTISGVEILEIDMKAPDFDEITGFTIARNAIGQKCTVAVSGGMAGVRFTSVSGADFTSEWNKGVFEFYWTGTGWMFGGYSPIVP